MRPYLSFPQCYIAFCSKGVDKLIQFVGIYELLWNSDLFAFYVYNSLGVSFRYGNYSLPQIFFIKFHVFYLRCQMRSVLTVRAISACASISVVRPTPLARPR